ncbi:MAG: hypothetical protein VX389_07140, partial [Acidobacteriota bacterium]|nr:hypothetical protein [Acidobacteriota bacterium]
MTTTAFSSREIALKVTTVLFLASAATMAYAIQDQAVESFSLIETGEQVVAPPDGTPLFYTKYINAGGVVIVSSDAVPDAALIGAYRTILHLTSKRLDVLE